MEKVVRAIGTLLLVGVLVLSVLTYAGIFNISEALNYIRTGVSRLVTWFIPKEYNVELVAGHQNAVVKGGNVIAIDSNIQLSAGTVIGYINVTLEGAPIEVVVEGSVPIQVVIHSAANATAIINNYGTTASATVWSRDSGFVTLAVRVSQAVSAPLEVRVYYRKA